MLRNCKWARVGLTALMTVALLSGGLAWAKKPVPRPDPPPEPDPPPVTYELTWLDTFAYSYVWAMNSHGHVVGHAEATPGYSGDNFAFLYTQEGGMVDLNTLLPEGSGWLLRRGWGINDQGQIVGYGELNGDPTFRAYRYTPAVQGEDGTVLTLAVVEQIGPLNVGDEKWAATSINELGEVCGVVTVDDVAYINNLWYYHDLTGIEPLLGELASFSRVINNAGQVFGSVADGNKTLFRVVPDDTPEFFQSPAGEEYTIWGNDMNDDGWFVGKTALAVTQIRKKVSVKWGAYRHDGVDFVDLGAGERSEALGINNDGDVVGTVGDGSGFLYLEGFGLVNLDDTLTGELDDLAVWFDGDTSIEPRRINDAGQIAGHAYFLGTQQAFLLTPVPDGN